MELEDIIAELEQATVNDNATEANHLGSMLSEALAGVSA